jgi:3-oxoacyl-[acyl-carrier-protein] synthase-3
VPEKILDNHDLEQMVETDDEWIRTRTGIVERRILDDDEKATSYMAARAAEDALQRRGMDADELDLIIVATVTPDYLFPATACLVQEQIGANNAYSFDLSAACSGFLYALSTGANMIGSGNAEKVMVIGADKMSSIVDYTDRTTCILFGDAAASVILEPSQNGSGVIDYIHHVEGDTNGALCQPAGGSRNPASQHTVDAQLHYIRQDGRAVFKKATEGMADVSMEIMEKNDLKADDIEWLVPHQANLRIINATANRMGLDTDKVMVNIDRYGNTTAATIPLCLYEWQDQLNEGDDLILSAFGGGFTWGSLYLVW